MTLHTKETNSFFVFRKDTFASNQCLNFFIFFFRFICYFLSNMLVELGSLRIFTTFQRKKQWGEKSMFHILNSVIMSSFFPFSCFFRVAFTCKCFSEQALVFVKRMSEKAFCPCLHTTRTLIFGLASSLLKPINPSL